MIRSRMMVAAALSELAAAAIGWTQAVSTAK